MKISLIMCKRENCVQFPIYVKREKKIIKLDLCVLLVYYNLTYKRICD